MSIRAVSAVLSHTFGSPVLKAVMISLADKADESWSCYPGQELIAAETELGLRTVQRALAGLEDAGIVARERRSRGGLRTSDRYYLSEQAIKSQPAALAGSQPATDDEPTRRSRQSQPAALAGEPSVREPSVEPPPVLATQGHPPDGEFALIAPIPIDRNADFDRFWKAFPRRTAKEAARKAWTKAITRAPAVAIIAAAQAMTDWPHLFPKEHLPYPATWLNQDRWQDDLAETYPPPKRNGVDHDRVSAMAAELDREMGLA